MVEQVSDFKMPEKIVTRLIKDALPEDVTLSMDARNAACRFAGIFLLQLSIAAAEKAQLAKRRTLDNQDIMQAMQELGLPECVPQLVRFGAQRKRNAKRKESNMIKGKHKKLMNQDIEQPKGQQQYQDFQPDNVEDDLHGPMDPSDGEVVSPDDGREIGLGVDDLEQDKSRQEFSVKGDENDSTPIKDD